MQDFEFLVQAALKIFYLLANVLITLDACKRISSLASDDQMAPPFGNLPPLKRWTKLFTFVLICELFLFVCFAEKELLHFV